MDLHDHPNERSTRLRGVSARTPLALLLAILVPVAGASCGDQDDIFDPASPDGGGGAGAGEPGPTRAAVQKGPYLAQTPVDIQQLDADLLPVGAPLSLETSDDAGTFALDSTLLSAPYVDAVAEGYYYDEVADVLTAATIRLRALLGVPFDTANVNVLTTLQRPRLVNLLGQGTTFAEAETQAQQETLAVFSIQLTSPPPSSSLTIAEAGSANGALLAVSAIVQHAAWLAAASEAQVPAQLTSLLAAIGGDLEPDGVLSDLSLVAELEQAAHTLDSEAVRTNLEAYYAQIGVPASIPPFETYLPLPTGQFVAAGSLPLPRTNHSVSWLPTGMLLLGGGVHMFNGSATDTDADVLDPTTLTVVGTYPTGDYFDNPEQATLADRVLLFGSASLVGQLSAAASFDPVFNEFSPVAELSDGPTKFSMFGNTVVLQDGRILIVRNEGGIPRTEVYDPVSGSRTPTETPLEPDRMFAPATVLEDGQVLLTGGWAGMWGAEALGTIELYDPASNSWSMPQSLSAPRGDHTQTQLLDGRILLAGGTENVAVTLDTAELYDPITHTITGVPGGLVVARRSHQATLLPDGRVLVTGGEDGTGQSIGSAEIFDPASDTFSLVPGGMIEPRANHTATLLADGSVLVIGGTTTDYVPTATMERFVP